LKSKDKELPATPSSHKYSLSTLKGVSPRLSSLTVILRNRTFIYYTLIPAILLSIIAIASVDLGAWNLFELHHFYIELFAVILGSILAFYYIARAYTLNDNFSRFVGFGFLVAAAIDLLHVIISYVYMDDVAFLKYFIPQTWFAGRIFLSAMLVIAITKYPTFSGEIKRNGDGSEQAKNLKTNQEDDYGEKRGKGSNSDLEYGFSFSPHRTNKSDRTFGIYLTILLVLAGSVAISSLYLVLPYSVIDEVILHRPYEIPSLILFIIALFMFYKNQLYKKTDIFYKGILAYLIIDIYAQIIMSYSAFSFDTPHNVAHILKDAGYFVNIIALALSSIQYNVRLRESNESLIESNIRLKEREEVIRIQYNKLIESEKIKDEFINTAAHELRTPIQPILGMTDIVRSRVTALDSADRDNKNAAKRSEGILPLLDVIFRNAKRLKQLTDNILDVTKIESHSFKLNRQRFDIERLIEETAKEQNITTYDKLVTEAGIKILLGTSSKATGGITDIGRATNLSNVVNVTSSTVSTPKRDESKLFLIEADKTKISQVLSNLLSNALSSIRLKQGTEDGIIIISINKTEKFKMKRFEDDSRNHESRNTDDVIIVSITDNGQGIPPDIAQNLFTKFVSGSDSGTGLGLYISKNIIEAHGGRIWARNNDSTAIDGVPAAFSGATFSFSLPVMDQIIRSN
jgi:signal transduction histidine kinase